MVEGVTSSGERRCVNMLDRPTQEQIKGQFGLGEWTLRRGDGTALKHYRVTRNRRGNLGIEPSTPVNLDGISILNLNRLVRYYDRIVKIWPAQTAQVRKVQAELAKRDALVTEAYSAEAWDHLNEKEIPVNPGVYVAADGGLLVACDGGQK